MGVAHCPSSNLSLASGRVVVGWQGGTLTGEKGGGGKAQPTAQGMGVAHCPSSNVRLASGRVVVGGQWGDADWGEGGGGAKHSRLLKEWGWHIAPPPTSAWLQVQ